MNYNNTHASIIYIYIYIYIYHAQAYLDIKYFSSFYFIGLFESN